MRLRGHPTLDYGQPLHVLRASLTVGGRTLAQGDVLPWQEIGLSPRKVHQLWSARLVGHERIDARAGAENPTALVAPPSPAPPAPVSPIAVEAPAPSRRKR